MDDIASTINQILGSKEGMEQVKSIASALGLDLDNSLNNGGGNNFAHGASAPPPINTQDTSASSSPPSNMDLMAMLAGMMNNNAPPPPPQAPSIDLATIQKLQSAMKLLSTEDHNTALLRALRPHMSEERQKKIDDAIKIMQLIRLLPLIKEMGLFGGD